uniref:AB hydrolase-1 domain-containing protein n=1 Tax=uncultured organism TaxID=155900 RepID=A0A0G3FL29_9ZZZZ|nr:hypothetical protein [uncultured organism]
MCMPKLQINDFNMYYQESGQGEPLFLIPGFSANHHMWDNIVPMLTDKFRVIQLDNRGSGLSDVPDEFFSIEQMADDIAMLAEHLHIKQAFFIGNSMGGAIVQALAANHPHLTKAIVLSNTFCKTDFRFHLYLEAAYKIQEEKALDTDDFNKLRLVWPFSEKFVKQNLSDLLELARQDLPFSLDGYQKQYEALNHFDSSSWASKITAPTLIMGGEDDLIVLPKRILALAKCIPHAKVHMFEDVGHLPSLEVPDVFIDLVRDFFG